MTLFADMHERLASGLRKEIEKDTKSAGTIWKSGEEPMNFDDFCFALDGNRMYPRQKKAFVDSRMFYAREMLDPSRTVTEAVLVWSKGTGKDMTLAKFFTYTAYVLSLLSVPPQVYMSEMLNTGLTPGMALDIVNVAPNQKLALQVFFGYIKTYLSSSIMSEFEIYPKAKEWKPGTDHIMFPNINLHLYSKTSESSGLDGFNLFRYAMDEFDEVEKDKADKIHTIFRTSSNTRFKQYAYGVLISYPRYEDGFMLNAYARALKSPDLYYADLATTNEVRPDFDMDSRQVQEEFEENYALASAMYLSKPLSTINAFFTMPERIDSCVDYHRSPICVTKELITKTELNNGTVNENVGVEVEGDITYDPSRTYFIGGDGGLKKDSFALSVYSLEEGGQGSAWICNDCAKFSEYEIFAGLPYKQVQPGEEHAIEGVLCGACLEAPQRVGQSSLVDWWRLAGSDGITISYKENDYSLPMMREELVVEVIPQYGKGVGATNRPVDFTSVRKLLILLGTTLHVKVIGLDPHNTAEMAQAIMMETGIEVKEIQQGNALQYKRAVIAKKMVNANGLSFLVNPTRDLQWKRLQDLNGIRVDHPKGGKKDVYDSGVNAIWLGVTNKSKAIELA